MRPPDRISIECRDVRRASRVTIVHDSPSSRSSKKNVNRGVDISTCLCLSFVDEFFFIELAAAINRIINYMARDTPLLRFVLDFRHLYLT